MRKTTSMPPKRRGTGAAAPLQGAKRGQGGAGGASAPAGGGAVNTSSNNLKAAHRVNSSSTLVTGLKGEKYEGELNDKGKREGHGVLTWPNGNRYVGEWKEGKMSGAGLFTYGVEGDRYEGQFLDDKKHGKGCYTFANGNKYEGDFSVDKRHGFGKYHWVCGDLYSGEWKEGRMEGRGVTVYSNGNRYEGDFKEDRREGQGKLTCTDGLIFDGMWKSNMRHGHGVLVFPTGDRYEGGWKEDRKHGKGTDIFVNGNVFSGMYENNVKCGKGSMKYANGDEYDGDWVDDKMHGQGTYRFGNGFVYTGCWAKDCRDGHGVYTFPNSNKYTGLWANDKRHGKGAFHVHKTDETYTGAWQAGKMDGSFVVTGEDGRERYRGGWAGGLVTGKGTMYVNGYKFHGEWDPSSQPRKTDGTIEIPQAHPPPPGGDAEEDPQAAIMECQKRTRLCEEETKALKLQLEDAIATAAHFKVQATWKDEQEAEHLRTKATNVDLQNELADLKAAADQVKSLEKKMKELLGEQESLQGALKTSKDRVTKLEKDLTRESSAAAKAKKEAKSLDAKEKEASENLKDAQKKLASAESELKTLRSQVKSEKSAQAKDDKRYEKLSDEAAERQQKIAELEKLLERLKSTAESAEKDRDRMKRALEKVRGEHASCDATTKALTEDLAKAKSLLEKATDRCKSFESDVASLKDKRDKDAKRSDSQANAKLLEAQRAQREAEAASTRLTAEKDALVQKLAALQADLAKKADAQPQPDTESLAKVKGLEADVTRLEDLLDEAKAARAKAERDSDEDAQRSRDQQKLEHRLKKVGEELDTVKRAHNETQRQLADGKAYIESLKKQFEDALREAAEKESANLTLTTHYNEATRKAKKLEQDLTKAQRRLSSSSHGQDQDQARTVETLNGQLATANSEIGALQGQVDALRTKVADLVDACQKKDDALGVSKQAGGIHEKEYKAQIKVLEKEKADILKQLQGHLDAAGPREDSTAASASQAEVQRLKALCKEHMDDLKFERAEVKTLQHDLAQEKKRRKRAEKNSADNLDAESLRMKMIHLRAELEKRTKECEELRSSQLKQNHEIARMKETPSQQDSDGRWNMVLMGGVDAGHSDLSMKVKQLTEQLEEKDRVIEDQRLEVNRVKLLESKLLAANNKIQSLSQSTSMDRNKGDFLSYTEQERFRAREMINKERSMINEHERKEMDMINGTLGSLGRPGPRNPGNPTSLTAIPRRAGSFPTAENADGEGAVEGMYARADSGSWRPKPPRIRPHMHAMHSGNIP